MRIVRETGFSCAVVNSPAPVEPTSDPFCLPRVAVPNLGGEAFAHWLVALEC
jgi:hypothetical protein